MDASAPRPADQPPQRSGQQAYSRDAARLRTIYRALAGAHDYDEWHWSAARSALPFVIMTGAVLVQHTTWTNAERALDNLAAADVLNPPALAALPLERIAELVRVSGTPGVKARRLRALACTVEDAGGVDALLALPTDALRARLLATHGIGAETADAILLYAAGRPVFQVDAYAQRLFGRVGMGPASARYDDWQRWFEDALPEAGVEELRRWHAYVVLHGKRVCRPRPRCRECVVAAACDEGWRVATGGEAVG